MQSLILMGTFITTTLMLQFLGFGISRAVDSQWPTLGLMTFLVLFLGAFFLAWPIAVRLAEWVILRMGLVLQTEQSGAVGRQAEAKAHRERLAPGVVVTRVGLAEDSIGKPATVRTKEERERRIYRVVASIMMVGLLIYGVSLMVLQNYNQRKRAGLPQTITVAKIIGAHGSAIMSVRL